MLPTCIDDSIFDPPNRAPVPCFLSASCPPAKRVIKGDNCGFYEAEMGQKVSPTEAATVQNGLISVSGFHQWNLC